MNLARSGFSTPRQFKLTKMMTTTSRNRLVRGLAAGLTYLTLVALPAQGQHTFTDPGRTYDPAVPTPRAVLGYDFGERFTTHRAMTRYLERIAAASPRVTVDTISHTFEGREMFLVVITSEANHAKLAAIQADARRVADPRGAGAGEVAAAIQRLPSIVWLGHSVHGGEASGVEAGLALIYQLAAGTDPETKMTLDSAVVLIDPSQNPDGRERHTHDFEQWRSAMSWPSDPAAMNNSNSWPGARTSHYGFDLNRDWFIHSHPETRGRVANFLKWMPHVTVDLHEQGSNASFYFAPPREPDNKNNPPHLFKWFDIFAAAHGAAFDVHGWSYFRREGYDSFYPGYGEGWPMLTGSIGMLFESGSSSGGNVDRNDGGRRTLRQAAWEHYSAEWVTVRTSARRRTELVTDYANSRAGGIASHAGGPMRAVAFERDDQGRADSLAALLRANGIDVHRLTADADLRDAKAFGAIAATATRLRAGTYLVDFAQPQGFLAKAILEPDAELDSAFVKDELAIRRAGQGDRFYDLTAWSLPYAFRVNAWTLGTVPTAITPAIPGAAPMPPAGRAGYGYAFAPGSEASIRLLASLLADSIRTWYAPRSFTTGGRVFPDGAFLVRVAANDSGVHQRVASLAARVGASVHPIPSAGVDAGTDLGSNSVRPIPFPKVAILTGAPISGNSWGFAWYAMDQRIRYPTTLLAASSIGRRALDGYTALIVPSVFGGLDAALGDDGKSRLADWIRGGGVLITIEGATSWLAQESTKLSRVRVRRDTTRADSTDGAPLPSGLPGVIARATIDTLSPLLAGVRELEIPVFANSDRILSVPKDLRPGEAVIRFAPENRVRLAGYYWPEVPARLGGSPWLWTERVGGGRVIAFAHDPNYRDLFRGLMPIFANAVFLGPTF